MVNRVQLRIPSLASRGSSSVIEPTPHDPKDEVSSPTTVAGTEKEKIGKNIIEKYIKTYSKQCPLYSAIMPSIILIITHADLLSD